MPRKPNYDQDKRRKEQDRKARKDAKRLDREQRRNERQAEGEPSPDGESVSVDSPADDTTTA
jgi:hypothetical protein